MQARFSNRKAYRLRTGRNTSKAQALVEVTMGFVLFLALTMMIIFFIIQVCVYFYLSNGIQTAARLACREIANQTYQNGKSLWPSYPSGSPLSAPSAAQDVILNTIAIPGIMNPNSSSQFQTALNKITGDASGLTYTVTVQANYVGGGINHLPSFPWNPLNTSVGGQSLSFNLSGYTVKAQSTYAVPH